MEGGGALCENTSVTHPVQSDDPDIKDKLDVPHTSSESGYAGSVVCSEDSRPKGNLSGPKPHNEDSMPRDISFPGPQPHKKCMKGTAPNSHEEPDGMSLCSEQSKPTGPSFSENNVDESLIHQSGVCKRCERACGICLGNVHHAKKHCKTCSVSYCETHVVDHYRSPALSPHELVDYKQTLRVSPAKQRSLQRSSSGILWMLLIILSVLTALTFHHCYEDPVVIPELRVMMLGKTGAGKSASGNTILGREAFKSEASAFPVTKSCDSQSGVVEGRNITVIDTPAITTGKAAWMSEKVDPGPHVFLLVIPLRRFTEEDGKEVKWIQSNFGEEALKFTIILFTGGDQMDQKNAEQFLHESSGLQTLVRSTGGGYHIFDNKNPRGRGQVKGLLEKIELQLRKNMGYSYSYGLHEQVTTAVRAEEERKRSEEEEERKRLKMERDIQINESIKTMEKRIEQKIMEQMELKMINRDANATATLNEFREVVKATTEQGGNTLQEQVKTAVREEEERKRRENEENEEATTEQDGNHLQEQVNTAEREEEVRKRREKLEEEKEEATLEQGGNSLQEQVKTAEGEEEATTDQGWNFLIYLVGAVCGLIGLAGLCFPESSQIFKSPLVCLSYLPGVVSGLIGMARLFFYTLREVVKATFFCLRYLSGVLIGFIGFWILGNEYNKNKGNDIEDKT